MQLHALKLNQLRNLAPLSLEPGPRFNVFSGDNGQGKTNLLEAIYLVGALRSFRTQRLAELIAFGADEAYVSARVEREGLDRVFEVTVRPRSRLVRMDKKAVRPIARYFGEFNVVLFAPEDLQTPRSSPRERRRFLDRAVFHDDPSFLDESRAYEKVVKNRNALLRQSDGRLSARNGELLSVYDQQLATHGARVIAARNAYLARLRPRIARSFDAITQTGLAADVVYLGPEGLDPASELDILSAGLLDAITAARKRDVARQMSTVGPHRDDLEWRLDARAAAAFASQGQLRAMVLAWKTAEMDLLEDRRGEAPILLLDDVSSELDPTRNQYLFEFLRERRGQCFITTTHSKHVLLAAERVDFEVASGTITARNNR